MKKKWTYILFVSFFLILMLIIRGWNTPPLNWTPTLASQDKIPFGTYVLDNMLTDIFPEVEKSYLTIYERGKPLEQNQMIISSNYFPDEQDFETLLNHVSEGGTSFISAHYFTMAFEDTLQFIVEDVVFNEDIVDNIGRTDSTYVEFTNPLLGDKTYFYDRGTLEQGFVKFDTSRARVVAINDLGYPVTIRQPFGKGEFILNTTPQAFTNAYILQKNTEFASNSLSLLPEAPVHWAEYYMQGRRESATPLRYILSQPGLAWAYYILIAALVLYMLIESKRKQRIIPIIQPLKNSTLEFIGTISTLYFKKKDHRSIANKRISFFLDQLNQKYFIPQHLEGDELYAKIASKSGKSIEEVGRVMRHIMQVRMKSAISEEELKSLNKEIEAFNL